MSNPKQNNYITEELDWLETKLKGYKKYVDDNPVESMTERIVTVGTGTHSKDVIAATIEQQIKAQKDILKDLPPILEAINKLREKEEQKKIAVRGKAGVPAMMQP